MSVTQSTTPARMRLPNWTDVMDAALTSPLPVTSGGTGAVTPAAAAASLGVQPREPGVTTAANLFGVPTVLIKDTFRASVEQSSGGRRTVIYDSNGYPSIMYIIPKFNIEDVFGDSTWGTGVHPAFVSNGVEKPYIMIGAYEAGRIGSVPVSMPGLDPYNTVSFDDAKSRCAGKGNGWHLMTNWEWAAVALWCLKNGYEPRGNSYYGRSFDAAGDAGLRVDAALPGVTSGIGRCGTGSGPASWNHDGTPAGIADLVGNIWEWVDGMKLVDNVIYMAADNYYAGSESNWSSISCGISASSSVQWSSSSDPNGFSSLSATQQKLLVLSFLRPALAGGTKPYTPKGYVYFDPSGTRLPVRGGSWSVGAGTGLAALSLYNVRSGVYSAVGFRLAFGA